MVNFETDTIVQVNPRQTITYIYIQRSEELQLAWKRYYTIKYQNKNCSGALSEIKAAAIALFNRLKPSLRKSLDSETFEEVKRLIFSNEEEELERATEELEDYLYKKNITKIDNTKAYNPARIEQENEAHGL